MAERVEIKQDGVYINGEKASEETARYYRRLFDETNQQMSDHPPQRSTKSFREILGSLYGGNK